MHTPLTSKHFTPSSASAVLRELEPSVRVLSQLYRTLERRHREPQGGDRAVDPVYFEVLDRFWQILRRIERQGARVADFGAGALLFPARRAGRTVLLHGRAGDASVRTWLDGGRSRPIDDGPWE